MYIASRPIDFEALTLSEARALQKGLAELVREETVPGSIELIAGVDAAYDLGVGRVHAAVTLWNVESERVLETATASAETRFPYVPGFLAWRELPVVLAAFANLCRRPHLVLVDGHGRAHPRRCGLACVAGLALDLPTAGCAKSDCADLNTAIQQIVFEYAAQVEIEAKEQKIALLKLRISCLEDELRALESEVA